MKYVVKAGDTLSKIAQTVYGDANRWREIVAANKDKIENPSHIRPGWELEIPGVDTEVAPPPAAPAADTEAPPPPVPAAAEPDKESKATRPGIDERHTT